MGDAGKGGAGRKARPSSLEEREDGTGDPAPWTLMGRAVRDYAAGDETAAVVVVSDAEDEPTVLPAAHFFRPVDEMPEVERRALEVARGRVLDVGAGAGAHALVLQGRGVEVTALEIAPEAAAVMRARGVRDVRVADVFGWRPGETWDTVLALMNGTTLAGGEAALGNLLRALASLLEPGGCILMDSTDPEALGLEGPAARVQLQLEYGGERTQPFPVLFAAPPFLGDCANAAGLEAEVVAAGDDGAYLMRLVRHGP